MSTKTLRKRIALVAVAGLGFGLLSATTASAADITAAEIEITNTVGGTTLASVGVCSVDATAHTYASPVSTGTVVAAGAVLIVKQITTTGTGTLVLTGPAVWYTVNGASVNSTGTELSSITSTGTNTLKTTGVGAVTLSLKGVAGNTLRTIGITVVAACSSATTPVAANTLINLTDTDSQEATGIDDVLAFASTDYDSTVMVSIKVLNGYKGELSAGLLTATATNGALIAFNGVGAVSTAFVGPTIAGTVAAETLWVKQDTTTNPGKALTTTITFAFNGVTVGTKTVTITGVAASLTVSDVVGGITGASPAVDGSFEFITKDNAGNSVESAAAATINWTTAGLLAGDVITNVVGTANYVSAFTTKGVGKFVCAAAGTKSSGSVDVAVGFLDSALNLVKSNTFKATCGGAADTFSVALDKASYSTGEIATLTITAKDALGFAVGDGTTVGAAIAADLGGLTILGSAAASTDEFSGGVKTYKFRVEQYVGSFVGQALITATTDTSVKTLQYKIVSSDTGIGLNDVLKAIVSLIASINKQIAALQKALLKK